MNDLLKAALAAILRHFLTMAATYLVTRGIWTQEAAASYMAALALFLVGVGWSIWQKMTQRQEVVAALAAPAGTTVPELHAIIAEQKTTE